MYATLKNNQLITDAQDGEHFVTVVDGPGVYHVRTCTERGDIVEFGTGLVTVERAHLAHIIAPGYRLPIFCHSPRRDIA